MHELEARQKWLSTRQARAQRIRSRTAFRALSAHATEQLIRRDFGSELRRIDANPAATVARAGKLVSYLGDYHAALRTPKHKRVLETSTVPLRVGRGHGPKRPVDLRLQDEATGFAARNPLQSVAIGRQLAEGTAVGSERVRIVPEGADVDGNVLAGGSVAFPDIGADEDALATPTIDGVDLSTVLRSPVSPEQIVYRVDVPAGASLTSVGASAVISRGRRILARVPAPTAKDAQGTTVPVKMQVTGDRLILSVGHRGLDVAYPVLVDPQIVIFSATEASPEWESQSVNGVKASRPGVIEGPNDGGYDYGSVGWAAWRWRAHPKYEVLATEFLDVTFPEAGSRFGGVGYWIALFGCGNATERFVDGGSLISPAGSSFEEWHYEGACTKAELALESHGPIAEGDTLSVGAILVEELWPGRPGRPRRSEELGTDNPAEPNRTRSCEGKPINCATGNEIVTQTDVSVTGRGLPLALTRTYNSQQAAFEGGGFYGEKGETGPFGYGWSASFGESLRFLGARSVAVEQSNGSQAVFEGDLSEAGDLTAPPSVQAKLSVEEDGSFLYVLPTRETRHFSTTGLLLSESDRNGNTTTLTYRDVEECPAETTAYRSAAPRRIYASFTSEMINYERRLRCSSLPDPFLASVTDPSGRMLTFSYDAEGLVEKVTDPMGHSVTYGYDEAGNLTSVTEPGETSPRWRFKYDSHHRLTEVIDGRGGATTDAYDEENRVVSQTDPAGHVVTYAYEDTGGSSPVGDEFPEEEMEAEETAEEKEEAKEFEASPVEHLTTITHEATGAVTLEHFDAGDLVGLNRPSQHRDRGGVDGQAGWMDERTDGQGADEVAGAPDASSGSRAVVLA